MTYETIDLTDPTVGHEWIVTKERTILRVTMPETEAYDAYSVDVVLPAGGVRELVGEWDGRGGARCGLRKERIE